jgi:uncharacterized protein VirK/YbjX
LDGSARLQYFKKNSGQSQFGIKMAKNGCFDGLFPHFLAIFCYFAEIWGISDIVGIEDPK